jgi:hypothetical protein
MINDPLSDGREKSSRSDVVLFRRESFEKILQALPNCYDQAGYAMIFQMGQNVGHADFKSVVEEQKKLNIPMTKPKILKKVLERYTSMGWGNFSIQSLDVENSAMIAINGNLFSESCSKKSVGCCFIQGMLAGLMTEVFETEPVFGEPRCLAMQGERCIIRVNKEKQDYSANAAPLQQEAQFKSDKGTS